MGGALARALVIFAGLMGAMSLAQFPEFSQQYLQRLAGKVAELGEVTQAFDASATASGLSREGALRLLSGSEALTRQQEDMRAAFALQARLADDLERLRAATPLQRLAMPRAFADPDLMAATYADFRPALPTTPDGAIAALIGYLVATITLGTALALLRRAWGGRRRAGAG